MGSMKTCLLVFLSVVVATVQSQASIPVIRDYSSIDNREFKETFPVGSEVGRIDAYDPDGKAVLFFLRGDGGEYFTIGRETGIVTLKKELDFETDFEIKMTIRVVDGDGQATQVDTKVVVLDENDNEPEFDDYAISEELAEDFPVGDTVKSIVVTDLDTKNSFITLQCNGTSALFLDACDKFGLRQTGESNKYWRGDLILKKSLDFEERFSYAVLLTAFDGTFYENNEIHIEVLDVNDSPPRFIQAGPSVIDEEEAVPTVFQTVIARDQDTTAPHEIRYSLIGDNTDRFQIDAVSGQLSNRIRLDYDSPSFPKGSPFELTIKAQELLSDGSLGNDPSTTATIVIKVTVLDINDNTPTFDKQTYTASVQENIVPASNVPDLQMTITDIDSGTFNSFELVSLNHTTVFRVIPSEDAASASATFYVVNALAIDYETGPREYVIQVEARQNRVPNPQRTGTATVTIKVLDVNDQTPSFPQDSYERTIPETSQSGRFIIDLDATDSEEGEKGTSGIKYQLYGNIPPHFQIDEDSGVVTVAQCSGTPGEFPCIDFERKQKYTLTVSATDMKGAADGRTRSVTLIINIEDENDVKPAIEVSYERFIFENERVTINPLRIDATDPDTVGGPLTFGIIGDSTGLWQITTETDSITKKRYGNVTAVRPILYGDAPDQQTGRFRFAVQVLDTPFAVTSDVTITVLDINNNAPVFSPGEFVERIPESTPGETFVIQVTATDGDAPTTGNGVLDISVGNGGRGKFYAKPAVQANGRFVSDIYTTGGATFNFETEEKYEMELVVRDRGTPSSMMGRGKLTVFITDINNKNPIIRPNFESVTISENTPTGRSVHRTTATDADDDSILRYSFTASSANDGNGAAVNFNNYDYRDLFRMDANTGEVFVNGALDRDRTSRITFDLLVQDIAATPVQTGTGVLLIHITEYNDQPPRFNTTQYNLEINEELNINSFIQNLYCTDEDDKIDSYSLTQDQPRRPTFFSFYSSSGAMLVESRIDYDPPSNIEKIELTAFCVDTGNPPLSASTKVTVTVKNINDNYPVFEQPFYRAAISEGRAGGVLNVQIRASDIDRGDYGVLKYRLLDTNSIYDQYFSIDEDTAEITISSNAVFDREASGFFGIQVEAYDSPMDPSVRLRSSVPVYLTISDINDNCPEFLSKSYSGSVPESAEDNTSIIDIIASDDDEGINAAIAFAIKPGSGNPPEGETLFRIGRRNGRVLVNGIIRRKTGIYNFIVTATDLDGSNATGLACSVEVPVEIEVRESLNSAPIWVRPPRRDFVIYVLESQYEGMLVYSAKATDDNVGENGVVDYYFLERDNLNHKTADFRINRVTGVIRAEVEFDREEKDTYFLTLLARDRGNPAASSETTLTIKILDVDDNDPKFPMKDGQVIPLLLPEAGIDPVRDGQLPQEGRYLGKCDATDADSDHENNRIFYDLLSAQDEVRNIIVVDRETCGIRLTGAVDYEAHPTLEFDILAYNEKNDDSVRRHRNKREVNPSILHVIVRITDENDNSPVFTESQYFGCISIDAPYRQTILEVSATDVDAGDNTRIVYSLKSGFTGMGFGIDPRIGIVYNMRTFRDSDPRNYKLEVAATDGTTTPAEAEAMIFVTSPSNVVKLKVNRALTDVQPFSQQLVNTLVSSSNNAIAFACIDNMRNHINDDGDEVLTATDVFVTAVSATGNGDYEIYPAENLVDLINTERQESDSPFNAIYITSVEVEGDDGGFSLEEDAVLAILIISILLIVMALILFCIACYCIRRKDRKKKKKIRSQRHAIVHSESQVETSINPVYDNSPQLQEPVYTTVQKVRPESSPISPVVIPAPTNLEPLVSDAPQNLEPAEPQPEEPVPVIETEVLPEDPVPADPIEPRQFQPEYEDRIETEVLDEPPELPPPPPEVEDDTIEVVIDDSPIPPASPEPSPEEPQEEAPEVTTVVP